MCQFIGNTEGIESFDIFKTKGFVHKLKQCTNLNIEPHDEFPSVVCERCFANVCNFYEFQEMCRESLEKFTKMQENRADVESEYVIKKSLDNEIITSSKGFQVDQTELKSEGYDLLEDPLQTTTDSLLEQEIEEPTSSWNCNKPKRKRSKRLKKFTEEAEEENTYLQDKEVMEDIEEGQVDEVKLTKNAADKMETENETKIEDNCDESEDNLANSSCEEGVSRKLVNSVKS